jgi:hypothetical protein
VVIFVLEGHPVLPLAVDLPADFSRVDPHEDLGDGLAVLILFENLPLHPLLVELVVHLVQVGLVSKEHQDAVVDLITVGLVYREGGNEDLLPRIS